MVENTKRQRFVVDASFVLSYLFPDESENTVEEIFSAYEEGNVQLISTQLLPFEVMNGLKTAVKRKRYTKDEALALLKNFLAFPIEMKTVEFSQILVLAIEKDLSVYDAAYLFLTKEYGIKLLSLDKRLVHLTDPIKPRKN